MRCTFFSEARHMACLYEHSSWISPRLWWVFSSHPSCLWLLLLFLTLEYKVVLNAKAGRRQPCLPCEPQYPYLTCFSASSFSSLFHCNLLRRSNRDLQLSEQLFIFAPISLNPPVRAGVTRQITGNTPAHLVHYVSPYRPKDQHHHADRPSITAFTKEPRRPR
jgi:hypothetical protein